MKILNQKIFSFIFVFLLITSIFVGLNFGTDNARGQDTQTVNIAFPYIFELTFNYTRPGLQVLVNLKSSDFNFMNLPYYAFIDSNGNYVYAWIEKIGYDYYNDSYYANVWIKMTNSLTYTLKFLGSFNKYMGINTLLDDLFNLSYGEYDNGINVFNFYDNFAGSELNNSNWVFDGNYEYGGFGDGYYTLSVNNGINESCAKGFIDVITSEGFNPQLTIFRVYITSASGILPAISITDSNTSSSTGYFSILNNSEYPYSYYYGSYNRGIGGENGYLFSPPVILEETWQSDTSVIYYANGQMIIKSYNQYSLPDLVYYGFGLSWQSWGYINVQYALVRTYPLNGVFPSYNYTIQNNQIIQNSISLNSILNITSYIKGDWYINNQLVLTNSSYYIFYANATGIYNIYENVNGTNSSILQILVFDPSQSIILAQNNGDFNNIAFLNGNNKYMINFTLPYNTDISLISLYLSSEQDTPPSIYYYNISISLINITNNQINYIYSWKVQVGLYAFYNLSIPSGLYLNSGNYSILINDTSMGSLYIGYFTSEYLYNSTNYKGFVYGNTFTNSIYPYFQIINANTHFINVTINEQGLPSNTQWYVKIQGNYLYSSTNSITFNLPYNSGVYNISFGSSNPLYKASPSYHLFSTSLPLNITYNVNFIYIIPSPYIEFIPSIPVPFNITVSWQYNPNNLPPDVLPVYNNTIIYNNNTSFAYWNNGNVYIYNYSKLFYGQNPNYITIVNFAIILWDTSQMARIYSYSLSNGGFIIPNGNSVSILPSVLLNNDIKIYFYSAQYYNVSFVFNGFYNPPPTGTITIKSYPSSVLSNSNTIPIDIQNTVQLYNGTYAILPNGSYSLKITLNTYDYILSYPSTFNISGSDITIIVNASVNYIPVYFYEDYLFNETIIINITGYTFFKEFVSYSLTNTTTFPESYIGFVNLTSGVYTINIYYTQDYSNYTIVNINTMGNINLLNFNNITNTAQFSFITNKYYNQIVIEFNYTGYSLNIISNLPLGNNFFYNITNLNYSDYFTFYGYSNGNNLTLNHLPAGYYYIYLFAGYNFLLTPEMKLYIYLDSNYTLNANFTYALYNIWINLNIQTYYWAINYTVPYNLTLNIKGIDNYYQNTYINYTFTFYNFNYSYDAQKYYIMVQLPVGLYNITVNMPQFNPSVQSTNKFIDSNDGIDLFFSPTGYTIIINSNSNLFNTISITFSANNGNVSFYDLQLPCNISLPSNIFYNYYAYYSQNNYYYASGSFYLNQNPFYLNLSFNSYNGVNITLYEQGLPYSVQWSVIVVYERYQLLYTSTDKSITFTVPQYTNIQINILNVSVSNYNYAPNVSNIQVNTQNYNSLIYFIAFNLYSPITNPSNSGGNNAITQSLNSLAILLNIPSQAITLGLFLVIFLALIGLIAYKTRNNIAVGITSFSLIGLGYILGVIPLWIIVFIFSSVIAIFLYIIFLSGGEGEE